MFHLCFFLFSIILFYILTPGILITIPFKNKKIVVALVHALIFATVLHFTHRIVWYSIEGFETEPEDLKESEDLQEPPDLKETDDLQDPPKPQNPSEPSLILNANVKWSENHKNYKDFIPYILNNYPKITSFNINNNETANNETANNETTDNNNAEIILKDDNNPDGVSFMINYQDKINVNEFEQFLNEKGYSKKKSGTSIPKSLS